MSYLRDIYNYIQNGETNTENLGLEIEHFIVDNRGVQISFDEISALIYEVGTKENADIIYVDGYPVGYNNGRYSISLEPSCQFEISINPYSSLAKIEKIYDEFILLWKPIFEERGYRMLTFGLLPSVERGEVMPSDIPISPKKRYMYMDAYFDKSGIYGKHMMRASASTQVSIDYKSEADLVRKLRVLEKISPILMIMMESKVEEDTTLVGVPNKSHLLRTQVWDDVDDDRTGFYPNSLDDVAVKKSRHKL